MILYGISNCDTVRKARKFLEKNNIEFTFHDFRKDGFDLETFNKWLQLQPLDCLVNKRSTSWKQLSDNQKQGLTDGSDLAPLIDMPTLIKRPVLAHNTQLLVGFKETDYQTLIDTL
ncbi:MAG: arsenate reductase [Thiotrichales bacterium]|nr:arsenate reductase [Thiotrichales bacterium]